MELEKQVTSLENAKRLKQLGVEQKSLFYWFPHRSMETHELIEWVIIQNKGGSDESCSAFTVAELGEILPRRNKYWSDKLPAEKWSNEFWCEINLIWYGVDEHGRPKNAYSINYEGEKDKRGFTIFLLERSIVDENLANAMAKMLIYLIENNLYDTQNSQKTQTT